MVEETIATSEGGMLELRDTFKLVHNSRGNNWEIKILKEKDQTDKEWFDRMRKLNTMANNEYGEGLPQ